MYWKRISIENEIFKFNIGQLNQFQSLIMTLMTTGINNSSEKTKSVTDVKGLTFPNLCMLAYIPI